MINRKENIKIFPSKNNFVVVDLEKNSGAKLEQLFSCFRHWDT